MCNVRWMLTLSVCFMWGVCVGLRMCFMRCVCLCVPCEECSLYVSMCVM